MDFVVEDGTGKADANSYITAEYLIDWAVAHGRDIPGGDPQAAALSGSSWLDAKFGRRYPGERRFARDQGLGWPRTGACDRDGYEIADDAVPREIMEAAAAAGLREMALAGSLAPDVAAGGAVKMTREQIGSLSDEKQFAVADGQRAPGPTFPEIEGLLSGLLKPRSMSIPLVRA